VQAFIAEWGAGRLGVSWSDPHAEIPTTNAVLARIGRGALLGLAAALVVVVFAVVTRAARVTAGSVGPSALLLSLLVAIFTAVRDELLLRGCVLRAFRHTLGEPLQLVVAGLVAAAARAGQLSDVPLETLLGSPAGLVSLLIALLAGVCFTTLWMRERGAWMASGAHAAWGLATTSLISGGACSVSWSGTVWGGGGEDASGAALVALTGIATVATLLWYRRRGRTS
jgi:membrane protease YdiL (CAAX protease family)